MIILCVCVLVVLILLYLHAVRNFSYWKNRNVPYMKPVPLFGNAYPIVTLKKSLSMFLDEIYTKSESPYYGFYVFDRPFFLLQDPELIKRVLVTDFDHFCDRSVMYNENDKYCAKTLFMLQNPQWKITRSRASPAFSSGKLKNMVPILVDEGKKLTTFIEESALDKSINCKEFCTEYAINVISACAFGVNSYAHLNSKFSKAAKDVQGTSLSRGIQIICHFFAPILVKLFRMKFLDKTAGKYLEHVFMNSVEERKINQTKRGDLMDLLIKMGEEDENFGKYGLIALALQYLVAGFESSGSTLAFALYELALDTDIQERLRTEISDVITSYEDITFDNIQKLKYLEMVIKETLRKYPTLGFLDRRCTKEYSIPNTNVIIEKGIPVYVPVMSLHYDEKYFPEPKKFDPERFSPENKRNLHPYTYMPFGEGYRNCLGAKFGMLNVSVGLINVLKRFKIQKSEKTPANIAFETSGFLIMPVGNTIEVQLTSLPV